MAGWTLPHEQSCYKLFYFTWRYRALLRSFTVQGRCIGLETRALLAAILWCHGSRFIMSQNRARWRAASSEAFTLYVIVAECGRAPKAFPKRAMRSPTAETFFTTKPRATGSFGVRYARRPRRTRGGRGRGIRYARTIVSALHVS